MEVGSIDTREKNYLSVLQKKSKRKHTGKHVPQESFFLPEIGSRFCHEKEYMIIISDGDIEPHGIKVARRRQETAALKKQALNKYKYLLNESPSIEGVSLSIALDLKIIAHKISRSDLKKLTSLKLDIKGEERTKEYYLQAIDQFIKNCSHTGGKCTAIAV